MNKKGFATSTIVFALLSVFLISISILLVTITNTNKTKNALNEKVVSNIEYGNSSINDIEQRLEKLENNTLKLDNVYPVGSIYMSNNLKTVEEVHNALGGTWKKYSEGRTIIGDGTTTDESGNALVYNANQTGGNTTQILKTDNLPSHNHDIPSLTGATKETKYSSKISGDGRFSLNGGGDGSAVVFGSTEGYGGYLTLVTPALSLTTNKSKTTTCINCNSTSFSVQDPYIVTYIYKRVK